MFYSFLPFWWLPTLSLSTKSLQGNHIIHVSTDGDVSELCKMRSAAAVCKVEPRATLTKSQEKRQRLAGQSCFCTLGCELGTGNHCGAQGEAALCVSYLGFIEIYLYLEKVPAHKYRCSQCWIWVDFLQRKWFSAVLQILLSKKQCNGN